MQALNTSLCDKDHFACLHAGTPIWCHHVGLKSIRRRSCKPKPSPDQMCEKLWTLPRRFVRRKMVPRESGRQDGFACLISGADKRHIVTDTEGHLVGLQVHQADIQDRDGAVGVLSSIRSLYPWLRHVFADGGYAGDKLRDALRKIGTWTIAIIKRSDQASGFEVLPRRWVVERTFAWLGRCRRLAKDFETTIASAVAWVFVAHIRTLTRRLARA